MSQNVILIRSHKSSKFISIWYHTFHQLKITELWFLAELSIKVLKNFFMPIGEHPQWIFLYDNCKKDYEIVNGL